MKKIILIFIFQLTLFHTIAFAQPGSLDIAFDTDGIQTIDFDTLDNVGFAVAVQSDGKIIVAGYSYNGTDEDFALVRLNTNGSLDNSFSLDGKVTTDFSSGNDEIHAIALQPDGKILVGGYAVSGINSDFAIARYNTDGSLDSTFNTDGKVATPFIFNSKANAIALQSDGKILLAGNASNGSDDDFALVRYNTDGSLDNSFNFDGKLATDILLFDDYINGIAIQTDGKIVVGGSSDNGIDNDFSMVRYLVNGSLDASFAASGIVILPFGAGNDGANSIALQSDGKILLAGYAVTGTFNDYAIARFDTSGILDNSFDTDGKVFTDLDSNNDIGYSVIQQPDNKILLAGLAFAGSNNDFGLVRYNYDGSLDTNFGIAGMVTTAIDSGSSIGKSCIIQPNLKILVAGNYDNGVEMCFAVARYNSGIYIGIENLLIPENSMRIYPNPVEQNAILEYNLHKEVEISIDLYDSQGKIIKSIMNQEKQEVGKHQEVVAFPEGSASGTYFVVVSGAGERTSVKIIK